MIFFINLQTILFALWFYLYIVLWYVQFYFCPMLVVSYIGADSFLIMNKINIKIYILNQSMLCKFIKFKFCKILFWVYKHWTYTHTYTYKNWIFERTDSLFNKYLSFYIWMSYTIFFEMQFLIIRKSYKFLIFIMTCKVRSVKIFNDDLQLILFCDHKIMVFSRLLILYNQYLWRIM